MSSVKIPALTPRLSAIASMIKENRRICDIGTDHALLPVFLVLSGKTDSCIAADVNKGPLERAGKTIKRYDCSEKVKTVLSDGFLNIDSDSFDDAVIAGMGGELIADIIDKSLFLKEGQRMLYLQPMTGIRELRTYLYNYGWTVKDEQLAKEGEKLYLVMQVTAGKDEKPLNPIFGSCLEKHMGKLELEYLDLLLGKQEKILAGLSNAKEQKDLSETKRNIKMLKEIRERYDNSSSGL